jgi:hypothetical protein
MQYHKKCIKNVEFEVLTLVVMKTELFTFEKCFTLTILQFFTYIIFTIVATAVVITKF